LFRQSLALLLTERPSLLGINLSAFINLGALALSSLSCIAMSAALIPKIASQNVLVVGAKRTPFGAFGGSLQRLTATQLGVAATSAALKQSGALPDLVGDCYFGNVIQSSSDAAYLARHVALQAGAPLSTPALTVNRLCGSGFETVVLGSKSIQLGQSGVVIAGGSENMSQAPLQGKYVFLRRG
jgi:acetyl-CoA acetyltransferase